jgi:hypothetical protein
LCASSFASPIPSGGVADEGTFPSSDSAETIAEGKSVKVSIENGELVIRLPVNKPPAPSASGKTLVVASTRGNQRTEAVIDGQPIIVGLNAYIAKPAR